MEISETEIDDKLGDLFPHLWLAITGAVREYLADYTKHAHKHTKVTERNIICDSAVDYLAQRAEELKLTYSNKNNVRLFNRGGMYDIKLKKLDDELEPALPDTQGSFQFHHQAGEQIEIAGIPAKPINFYAGYVPNENDPANLEVWLVCREGAEIRYKRQLPPPAAEGVAEITPSPIETPPTIEIIPLPATRPADDGSSDDEK